MTFKSRRVREVFKTIEQFIVDSACWLTAFTFIFLHSGLFTKFMGTLNPDLKIKNFFRNIYAGIFPGDKLKISIQPITRQILLSSLAGFACIGVLYLSSLYNYLLFHSLV
ncbi:MAG: hypothetical protein NT121_00350, partial [Chloroflexi bacterium]|nr:hypothetical protein [Chloroflexota bacterium]